MAEVIQISGSRKPVGISATLIFSCVVKNLQTLELQAVGDCEIGSRSVVVGDGIPLKAGVSRFITHLDFRKDDKKVQESLLEIYAVAGVATTAQVSKIVRS